MDALTLNLMRNRALTAKAIATRFGEDKIAVYRCDVLALIGMLMAQQEEAS